jgi:hypothetical protein
MPVNPIQVQKFLKGIDYPLTKRDLAERARQQGADDDVQRTIEQLPMDRFNSPKGPPENYPFGRGDAGSRVACARARQGLTRQGVFSGAAFREARTGVSSCLTSSAAVPNDVSEAIGKLA